MKSRRELEARLIEKASLDPSFRAMLTADPKGVIERELGVKVPPDVRINVLEEKGSDYFLVLPVNPEVRGDGTISDQQLDAVAGGYCFWEGFECGCEESCY